ncbi:large ribosomal subunit protein bL21m [Drosophila sulfurigaster albostrigata]|uniref:large ribosomal subunit protein bL21m n=1 Tax=Drosophila sulfurigaster albostrigata TaxID=89887 RepID=UPI002D21B829|nr:large ribosomal subunit protein bL21m [Drosophila sulfurigaster albostrigata]
MSFLAQSVRQVFRHTTQHVSLSGAMRALSISPALLQQNKPAPSTIDVSAIAKEHSKEIQSVCEKINQQVAKSEQGRLFAVVHLCGKQFKITPGDIILVEGYWPPTIGDEISLDKVLLAGARDFTLIGRPILEPGLVTVKATIIEKTLTHTKTHFKKKRRKQYMRINFQRSPNTMIRINSIELTRPVEHNAADAPPSLRLF